jgi:hypothetical protein
MDIEWRTVQLFLGEEGISETSVATHDNRKVRCSCAVFFSSGRCKHAKYVRNKMANNDGKYEVQIPVNVPDEDALEALGDNDAWREFIYKYGKVAVID